DLPRVPADDGFDRADIGAQPVGLLALRLRRPRPGPLPRRPRDAPPARPARGRPDRARKTLAPGIRPRRQSVFRDETGPDQPRRELTMASPARVVLAFALAVPFAAAQTAPHDPAMHQRTASSYAGQGGSEIKALSADEMKALKDGAGMGLAKPAEL